MATLRASEDYYRTQALLAVAARRQAARAWAQVQPESINTWDPLPLARFVAAVQLTAVRGADTYTDDALTEQNIDTDRSGSVSAAGFVGVAGDGRSLVTLLDEPRIGALERIGQGMGAVQALAQGGRSLDMYAVGAVQDAGRAASGVALTARPQVSGYTRMLVSPSCSRCAVLAGRVYRWSAGFLRHPRCDCRHIPVAEDTAGDLTTDPRGYFDSLTRADQDRIFTKVGAQAARDGADLGQVVNARRGMATAQVGGRNIAATTEGTTRRGIAGKRLRAGSSRRPRLMPETIYRVAEDRADALRLLRANGFLT